MNQILLIFGPSGVGKSTLADKILRELNFLHFNYDYWDLKGIKGEDLGIKLSEYFLGYQPELLRSLIEKRLTEKQGAVLTFPSIIIPAVTHIKEAQLFGITTLILYGSAKNCLNSFIAREKKIGRNLSPTHWYMYNNHIYNGSSLKPEHIPFIINAFQGKKRRSDKSLMKIVRERLGL